MELPKKKVIRMKLGHKQNSTRESKPNDHHARLSKNESDHKLSILSPSYKAMGKIII